MARVVFGLLGLFAAVALKTPVASPVNSLPIIAPGTYCSATFCVCATTGQALAQGQVCE